MRRHPLFKPYLALAAVCLFWGTTYLAIRMALESFPPLILVSARYIVSGSILLGFALARGLHVPRGRELAAACFSGLLVLGIGNGALVYAETAIPSGIAGLIVSLSPFWMVGAEALLPGGERLHAPTIGGMLVGLLGVGLLFTPEPGTHLFNGNLVYGFLVLQIGMAGWCFGSIYQRRQSGKAHSVITGAVQQLAAGLILAPLAIAVPHHPIHWTARGSWRPRVPGGFRVHRRLQRLHLRHGPSARGHRVGVPVRQFRGGRGARMAVLSRAVRRARDRFHGGDLLERGARQTVFPPGDGGLARRANPAPSNPPAMQ